MCGRRRTNPQRSRGGSCLLDTTRTRTRDPSRFRSHYTRWVRRWALTRFLNSNQAHATGLATSPTFGGCCIVALFSCCFSETPPPLSASGGVSFCLTRVRLSFSNRQPEQLVRRVGIYRLPQPFTPPCSGRYLSPAWAVWRARWPSHASHAVPCSTGAETFPHSGQMSTSP